MAFKPYIMLLPLFMDHVEFFKSLPDIDVHSSFYKGKSITDEFVIAVADNLPTPATGDCGVHMATFAEYFITDDNCNPDDFNVALHRKWLAYLLWNHARMKQDVDYHSTDESPGPLPVQVRGVIDRGSAN